MNVVLIRKEEMQRDGRVVLCDRRARHVLNVLKARPGQGIRVGLINGRRGTGIVESTGGGEIALKCDFNTEAFPELHLDLLLALPRPKVIKRLWSPLASLGLRRIFLTNAEKVEREYFDTHWLEPDNYGPLLVEGLEQAGDTRMPEVSIIRRLKPFIEDKLDTQFPGNRRLIAHPGAGVRIGGLRHKGNERVLLAIGPEGGWTDFELELFAQHGFERVTLGSRKLRTDTACVSLIAVLSEWMDSHRQEKE